MDASGLSNAKISIHGGNDQVRRTILLLAAILLYERALYSQEQRPTELQEKSFQIWKDSCNRISTFDVTLSARHSHARKGGGGLKVVAEYDLRQRGQGRAWRVDFLDTRRVSAKPETENPDTVANDRIKAFSWDGRIYRSLDTRSNIAVLASGSHVNEIILGGPLFTQLFSHSEFGASYPAELQKRNPTASELSDGVITIVAGVASDKSLLWQKRNVSFELATENGFLPKKFAVTSVGSKGTVASMEYEISYKQSNSGIWCPATAKRTVRSTMPDGTIGDVGVIEIEVDVVNAKFNSPILSEVFELKAPAGTIVYDEFEHKNHIVGKDGSRDYGAYQRRANEIVRESSPQAKSTPIFSYVFYLGVAFLTIGAITLILRNWKQNA